MTSSPTIDPSIQDLFESMVSWRRHFHRHPEIGLSEHQTSAYIRDLLDQWGVSYRYPFAQTGLIATIQGEQEGPVRLFRADMDALPILEENQHDFVSLTPGTMHACGHDGHMAMLLGTIRYFTLYPEQLKGTLHCIFQPAEENFGGAKIMIDEGVLEVEKPIQEVYALHHWSTLPVGEVALHPNKGATSADQFQVTITGQGTHAALPHLGDDPLLTACFCVTQMQTIISRHCDPLKPAVLSVTYIKAGNSDNVIAPQAIFGGTLRCFHPQLRKELLNQLKEQLKLLAQSHGCQAEVTIKPGYPALLNHREIAQEVTKILQTFVPQQKIHPNYSLMGSEDFAYFLQKIPGTFILIGSGSEQAQSQYPHHHPQFNIDERSLLVGCQLLVKIAQSPSLL